MSKISNVILMLQYLSSGRKYSVLELSEKLEVSPRMVRIYKEELEKAGIYIDTIKGPYGGYVLNQNTNSDNTNNTHTLGAVSMPSYSGDISTMTEEQKKQFFELTY